MTPRINLAIPNAGLEAMRAVEAWLQDNHGPQLLALVMTRTSQINGCTFCLRMHSGDVIMRGETHTRPLPRGVWHESGLFSPRERAALPWTEALTRIAETHAPASVYEEMRRHFSEDEIVVGRLESPCSTLSIALRSEPVHSIRRAQASSKA